MLNAFALFGKYLISYNIHVRVMFICFCEKQLVRKSLDQGYMCYSLFNGNYITILSMMIHLTLGKC